MESQKAANEADILAIVSEGKNGFEGLGVDPLNEDWIYITPNIQVLRLLRSEEYDSVTTHSAQTNIASALDTIASDVQNAGIFNNTKQKNNLTNVAESLKEIKKKAGELPTEEELTDLIVQYNNSLEEAKCQVLRQKLRKAAEEWNNSHEDDKISYDFWITVFDTFLDMGTDQLYNELARRNALPFSPDIRYSRPADTKYSEGGE